MRLTAPGSACLAALALAGCEPAVLEPRGPIGLAEKTILIDSLVIMLAIVLPTIVATISAAWWFRASNPRARRRPEWSFSGRIELVVWSVPLMTIILLGGVTWLGAHQLDPARPLESTTPPLHVQVVSLDWKWLFIYPDLHLATVNRLVVPTGVPLHFSLTSASVMNAFFIPQLGSMIYTMNGMATELNLRADSPGRFVGRSSHFSGDGFSGMHFDVDALAPEQFAAWAESIRSRGATLDAEAYAALAQQSLDVAPASYRAVEDELFKQIVAQHLAPGPGPAGH